MIIHAIRTTHVRKEHPLQSDYSMHTHDQYEILYLIHGNVDLTVEGNVYHLKTGDLILMRKSESHYLIFRSTVYYERIVVTFDIAKTDILNDALDRALASLLFRQPLGKYNHFSASLFPDNHWYYYLNRICHYNDPKMREMYLLPLLNELSEEYETVRSQSATIIPSISSAMISYINQHLFEDLSLDTICAKFFLSKSQVNRIFRKATGSTIWNYIVIKRLLYAKELLQNGENPTLVCEKIGYKNYVTFYKSYKNFFHHAPKADYQKRGCCKIDE